MIDNLIVSKLHERFPEENLMELWQDLKAICGLDPAVELEHILKTDRPHVYAAALEIAFSLIEEE